MTKNYFNHVQSIYSCKRRATLFLQHLGKEAKVSDLLTAIDSSKLGARLSEIYSPIDGMTICNTFPKYIEAKNKPENHQLTRGLLLDFFASVDGFSSWETFHHYHQGKNDKTYIFTHNDKNYDPLYGYVKVYVVHDNGQKKSLYNPAIEKFGQLDIGYAWGYSGSSCTELSRALCYDLGQEYLERIDFVRDWVLGFFPNVGVEPLHDTELLFTEKQLLNRLQSKERVPGEEF